MFSRSLLLLLFLSISWAQSCKTIVELAASSPDLSTLVSLLKQQNLLPALQNATLTVFAPTNRAFSNVNIAAGFPLTPILTYHVVAGSFDQSNLQDGQQLTTLQGGNVTVGFNFGRINFNAYSGAQDAIPACFNSRVFIVDHVLIPPCASGFPTALSAVAGNQDLSILGKLVSAAGLASALKSPGHLTVFAPTDTAFAALNLPSNLTAAQLAQVILYHVAPERLQQSDLSNGLQVTTLNGDSLTFSNGGKRINGVANIIISSVATCNAVVHIIDHVLLPHGKFSPFADVATTIQNSPHLQKLNTAITMTGLTAALRDVGPFTVLAPNNEAFAHLIDRCCLSPAQVLLFHVSPNQLLSSDVPDGSSVTVMTLLQQQTLTLQSQGGGNLAVVAPRNTAYVIPQQSNIPCSNGIIHTIDAVLLAACSCK